MARKRVDEDAVVDLWGSGWAYTRRSIWQIDKFLYGRELEPHEIVGPLNSTLGLIKEDREGAGSAGVPSQRWPEVYTKTSLIVHRAWYEMPEKEWMLIWDAHYVWREIKIKDKAPFCVRSKNAEGRYHQLLPKIKTYVRGYVAGSPALDGEFIPKWTPARTHCRLFDESKMHMNLPKKTRMPTKNPGLETLSSKTLVLPV